jgi:hypothetical protein
MNKQEEQKLQELRIAYLVDDIDIWQLLDKMIAVIHTDKSEQEQQQLKEKLLNSPVAKGDPLYEIMVKRFDR